MTEKSLAPFSQESEARTHSLTTGRCSRCEYPEADGHAPGCIYFDYWKRFRLAADLTAQRELLKRLVMAWDCGGDLDFMAAIRAARKVLGFSLSNQRDDNEERAVLKANTYPEGDW